MIIRLIDESAGESVKEVWLRHPRHVVLPYRSKPQTPTYSIREIKPDLDYLKDHMDEILPHIREKMGLTAEPLTPTDRAISIVLGLMGMLAALGVTGMFAAILNVFPQPIVGIGDLGFRCLFAMELLASFSMVLLGLNFVWKGFKPSRTQEAINAVQHLIADGKFLLCDADIEFYRKYRILSLWYLLSSKEGQQVRVKFTLPRFEERPPRENGTTIPILVLAVDDTLNAVL